MKRIVGIIISVFLVCWFISTVNAGIYIEVKDQAGNEVPIKSLYLDSKGGWFGFEDPSRLYVRTHENGDKRMNVEWNNTHPESPMQPDFTIPAVFPEPKPLEVKK